MRWGLTTSPSAAVAVVAEFGDPWPVWPAWPARESMESTASSASGWAALLTTDGPASTATLHGATAPAIAAESIAGWEKRLANKSVADQARSKLQQMVRAARSLR